MLIRVAALSLSLVLAVTGCSSQSGDGSDGPTTGSYTTKDIVACQAVQQANTNYLPQLAPDGESSDANILRGWVNEVNQAAVVLDDPVLKAQLLNLAQTVQDWIVRPPSKTQVEGYVDDMGRACGQYLNPSPSPTS
jgi:hypothetical protein